MSQQTNQVDELSTLRQTVAELTQKNATRKARIAELEQQLATSQSATQTATASLHEIQVAQPMRAISEALSGMPELFDLEMKRLGYRVALNNGQLALLDGDAAVEGVEVSADGLRKHFLNDDERHRNFKSLIIANRASGGGAVGSHSSSSTRTSDRTEEPSRPKLSLGLR